MAVLLDLRTSQGPKTGPVSTVAITPDYIAGIGLFVDSAPNIRVDLEASVGVSSIISNALVLSVVRHTLPGDLGNFGSGIPVYSQTFNIPTIVTATTFSLSAADYLPPTPGTGLLVYGLYASATFTGTTYQGTQNLIGTAVGL
jgi:hypothetical protein